MKSNEIDALVESQNGQVNEKRAAGLFSITGEEALDQAKADKELWELILSKEVEFSKNPACLDCGANIIYIVRKG